VFFWVILCDFNGYVGNQHGEKNPGTLIIWKWIFWGWYQISPVKTWNQKLANFIDWSKFVNQGTTDI
jgi:hypothetical protein